MVMRKFVHLIEMLAVRLSIAALAISVFPTQIQAQPYPVLQAKIGFPPAPNRGAPERTRGAGSRKPTCDGLEVKIPLTPLMPENNVGTTIAPNPTIYVYVPEFHNKEAEFLIIDQEAEKVVYQTRFRIRNTPGIVKITLPNTVELKSDKNYLWHLGIICNPNDQEADEVITGWIERISISPELEAKIEQLKQQPLEQGKLYAEAGIWSESLTILAQLRDVNPRGWVELLESVGLGEIAQNPIFECCQIREPSSTRRSTEMYGYRN